MPSFASVLNLVSALWLLGTLIVVGVWHSQGAQLESASAEVHALGAEGDTTACTQARDDLSSFGMWAAVLTFLCSVQGVAALTPLVSSADPKIRVVLAVVMVGIGAVNAGVGYRTSELSQRVAERCPRAGGGTTPETPSTPPPPRP